MAGPGGKRLSLGNQPSIQISRGKQMSFCVNSVRYTFEESVPPLCHRYLTRCGVLLQSSYR